MKDFKKKIEAISGKTSNWKENARYRKENKWLSYSSQIALRILALIEADEVLNQSKLAEAINVSPQQISKIIKGRENLTLETIYKLSEALKADLITFPPYKYSHPIGPKDISTPEKSVEISFADLEKVKDGARTITTKNNVVSTKTESTA